MLTDNKIQFKKPQSIQNAVVKHVQKWKITEKSVWEGTRLFHSSGYRAPHNKKTREGTKKFENLAAFFVGRLCRHGFRELFDKFHTVILATIKGNLLVAAVQGALGGIAFWFLGVTGAVLWAVVMAFLSLVPAVGASLVWLPFAIYFLVSGAVWKGIGLIIFGVMVIGLIDNLLRPMLVGKSTRLPDYMVMITTLGGMSVIGINGFVIGPLIAAMFMAIWHIYGVAAHSENRE